MWWGGAFQTKTLICTPNAISPISLLPRRKGNFGRFCSVHRPFKFQHMMCSKINDRRETVHGGCILSAHLFGTIDQFHRGAHRIPPRLRQNGFIDLNYQALCPRFCLSAAPDRRGRYATIPIQRTKFWPIIK